MHCGRQLHVALLAEGVDRNKLTYGTVEDLPWVALLAEGVDRNTNWVYLFRRRDRRPPRGGRG